MGLGCGGGCQGLDTTPVCNRAACTSALGNTECQQPTHRTVYLPWCPGRSCPGSQEEAHANSHPSAVRTDWAVTVTVTWSMEDEGSKLSSFQITYGHTKQRSVFTFLLWLSQWNIARLRPHILLSEPFLDSSHSNTGQTPSSAIVAYKLDLLNISGNSVWAHKPFPRIKSEWK